MLNSMPVGAGVGQRKAALHLFQTDLHDAAIRPAEAYDRPAMTAFLPVVLILHHGTDGGQQRRRALLAQNRSAAGASVVAYRAGIAVVLDRRHRP